MLHVRFSINITREVTLQVQTRLGYMALLMINELDRLKSILSGFGMNK